MENFWFDLALSVLFTTLRGTLKNPKQRQAVERQLTKLRDQLLIQFPIDEPELQSIAAKREKLGVEK